MKKKRSSWAKLMAAVLVASQLLCACSSAPASSSQAESSAAGETSSSQTESGAAEETAMYPVEGNPTITMAKVGDLAPSQAGYTSYSETPGFQEWQARTGVTIELSEPMDDPALLLMLSSGTAPDIVIANKDVYPGGVMKMVEDRLAINLSEHRDWCPDYMEFLESDEQYSLAATESDGNVYSFVGYGFEIGSPYRCWQGLIARQEYLDQLGMEVPNTADEFYEFLTRCKNELGVETPLTGENLLVVNLLKKGVVTSPFGLPTSDIYHDGDTVKYGAYEPAYCDVLEFMNKLYSEKLLDNDYAVLDAATAQASMISGDSAVIIANNSRLQTLQDAADSEDYNLVALPNLVAEEGDRPMYCLADPYLSKVYTAFVTGDCQNPEAAVKFMNYLHTDEGIMLYNFGIEGVSYEMVDGSPVYTETITNDENYSRDQLIRVYGLMNFPGLQLNIQSEQRFPQENQREAYKIWSDTDVDKYQIVNTGILPELVDEHTSLMTDIKTFIDESTAKFIAGTEPLSNFDQYIDTLNSMGMERLLEIVQESYEAYN